MDYEILNRLIISDFNPMVGIGIGTPGLVNTNKGVVVNAVYLSWQDLTLASLIEECYKFPVYFLDGSQVAALAYFGMFTFTEVIF